jgi:hypothetical protein
MWMLPRYLVMMEMAFRWLVRIGLVIVVCSQL